MTSESGSGGSDSANSGSAPNPPTDPPVSVTTGTPAPHAERDPDWSWRTPAAALGVLGLAAGAFFAVLAYWPSADSAESAREQTDVVTAEAGRLPNLKVARTLAYLKGDLSGSVENEGDGTVKRTSQLVGPHIDITFENRANGPALITKVIAKYREMGYFDTCSATGGSLIVSANYDLPVQFPPPAMPYTVQKEISFEVKANELDRLTLTTGPKIHGMTWYGIVDITLEHDGGKKQDAGTFALVSGGDDQNFYPDPDRDVWVINHKDKEPKCLKKAADLAERLAKTPRVVVSKELASLRLTLDNLGY